MSTLDKAIEHIRMGNQEAGRQILEDLLDVNENDETIWLWLSLVVEADEDREICLENAIALDPGNEVAQRGVEALRSGSFDVNDLMSDLLDEDELEEEFDDDDAFDEPATFIDDFVIDDEDEFDDDDFSFGDSGEGSKKKGGFNPRYLILGVLVLILIIVLGALAFVSLFLMSDDGGQPPVGDGTPAQEAPADGGEQAPELTATPTETPTPAPTDTPTATPTSALQLPTSRPTGEPTPTATRVVSPTPIR